MFAFLALAGDLGCSGGPSFVGIVSGYFGDNLKIGILGAVLFPVILVFILIRFYKSGKETEILMKNNGEQMNCDI